MKLRLAPAICFAVALAGGPLGCSAKSADPTPSGPSCTAAGAPASVPVMLVAAAPPAPQGGTITLGSYVLTDYTGYTGTNGKAGPDGSSVSGALVFDTNNFKSWLSSSTPDTFGGAYSSHGTTMLTLFLTCPNTKVQHVPYTASADSVQLFSTSSTGATIVGTYTLQCQAGAFPGMGC